MNTVGREGTRKGFSYRGAINPPNFDKNTTPSTNIYVRYVLVYF